MVRYTGNGESTDDPVIILDVEDHFEGIRAEYQYLEKKFGKRGFDWELEGQSLMDVEGRKFDKMDLIFPGKIKKNLYFEVTNFMGMD